MMTLDGTNTWVLRGPRSDELVIVDPGPDDDEHIARLAALGRIALVLISHRHGDHTDGIDKLVELTGATVRSAGSGFLRGLRRRADRRRSHRRRRPEDQGDGHPRPHRRLAVVPARRRGADCRHRARPRHHRDRQRGRQPDRLPGIAAAAAGAGRRRTVLPGHGPDLADLEAVTPGTWRTATNGSTRCAQRCGISATTPPPARSSNTSTPTSTRSSGTRPNSPCRRSWTTCGLSGARRALSALGGPVARSPRSARSCPPGGSSRGGRNRPAPC